MNWFTQLLGVQAPPDTSLADWELRFRSVLPIWGFVLLVILFGAVSFTVYFLEISRRVGVFRRVVMGSVRSAIFAFLLVLICRPYLLVEFGGERPRSIALMVDNTQSMDLKDYRTSPNDQVRVAIAKKLVPLDTKVDDEDALSKLSNGEIKKLKEVARMDIVTDVFRHPELDLLDSLNNRGPLEPYLFGASPQAVTLSDPEDAESEEQKDGDETKTKEPDNENLDRKTQQLLRSLNASQSETALADSIFRILQRRDSELPGAIVVISDGHDTSSKNLLQEAAAEAGRLKVPLHIYGVGATEAGILKFIDSEVIVPKVMFYEDNVSVPLRWQALGFKKGVVEAEITFDNKIVAKKKVDLETGQELEYDFRRNEYVDRKFRLNIGDGNNVQQYLNFTTRKDKATEKIKDKEVELVATLRLVGTKFKDRIKKEEIRLTDTKIKVLYIEYTPRWEFRFLLPMLRRDRRINIDFLLLAGDSRLMKAGPPFLPEFPKREDLAKYDLILLGDVPYDYLKEEDRGKDIKNFVYKDRGGLIVLSGRHHMPLGYVNTPLAELLPVEFIGSQTDLRKTIQASLLSRQVPHIPKLTQAGETMDMMTLADTPKENRKVWETLPGFYWAFPNTKLRPSATALLVHREQKNRKGQPLAVMATHYYGLGEVMFVATDETWRWRYNTETKHYNRFWGQIIYRFALPHLLQGSSNRVQMALARSEAFLDQPGSVYARLLDKKLQPRKEKAVQAQLSKLGSNEPPRDITLRKITGREGEYRAPLENDEAGVFQIRIPGTEGVFTYAVQVPKGHEREPAALDTYDLKEMARLSGGKFYREEDLKSLTESVPTTVTQFTVRQEILLWNPLTFLIFLLLIATEWVIRKYANLS
ncbi:MAG: hypothetical protein ACFCD0_05585 [Gemmataceae bacterium]